MSVMSLWSGAKRIFRIRGKESFRSYSTSSGYGPASWTPRNYENFANETYLKNVIAFRCIDEIAKATASVPWGLFNEKKSGTLERVYEHDMSELIKRPNPEESFEYLMLKWQAFLLMAGNSFLRRVSPLTRNQDIPKELYVLRPDRMEIINPDGYLQGFKYIVDGRPIEWEVDPITQQCDVLQYKLFHPTDDWWGASITESVAREVDTLNEQVEWNKKLLENEGRPGMILTFVGNLSPRMFEYYEKALKDKFSGAENAGRNMILEGEAGTKAEPYGWSPTDLDFLEGGRELARRICNGYNVPPQILGIPGDNKYANYQEARQHFYEGPIFWYLRFFRGEVNNWLFKKGDSLQLNFMMNDHPALSPKRDKMWDRAQKSNFITVNEKRTLVEYTPIGKAGDVILVPANLVPIEASLKTAEEIEEEEDEDEKSVRKTLRDKGYKEDQIDKILGLPEVNKEND